VDCDHTAVDAGSGGEMSLVVQGRIESMSGRVSNSGVERRVPLHPFDLHQARKTW
jgi:hypothetical protein